jgi:hypothetical protein
MMASKKSEAGTQRPKQKSGKQLGMMQFVLIGVGVIALIVIALLLSGGGGKKAAAPRANATAADTGSIYGQARKPSTAAIHKVSRTRAAHDSLIAKRREARLQRDLEIKASGGRSTRTASGSRTRRTSSGGFTGGGSTRGAAATNQLTAIVTDNSGSRTALVGERRLKAGDDVEGHRIVEVSGDGVKVEYRQNTYTVRVGEKIY